MRAPARDAGFPGRSVVDGDFAAGEAGREEGAGGGEGEGGDGGAGEGDLLFGGDGRGGSGKGEREYMQVGVIARDGEDAFRGRESEGRECCGESVDPFAGAEDFKPLVCCDDGVCVNRSDGFGLPVGFGGDTGEGLR